MQFRLLIYDKEQRWTKLTESQQASEEWKQQMAEKRVALLAGATGASGSAVLREFGRNHVAVRALGEERTQGRGVRTAAQRRDRDRRHAAA